MWNGNRRIFIYFSLLLILLSHSCLGANEKRDDVADLKDLLDTSPEEAVDGFAEAAEILGLSAQELQAIKDLHKSQEKKGVSKSAIPVKEDEPADISEPTLEVEESSIPESERVEPDPPAEEPKASEDAKSSDEEVKSKPDEQASNVEETKAKEDDTKSKDDEAKPKLDEKSQKDEESKVKNEEPKAKDSESKSNAEETKPKAELPKPSPKVEQAASKRSKEEEDNNKAISSLISTLRKVQDNNSTEEPVINADRSDSEKTIASSDTKPANLTADVGNSLKNDSNSARSIESDEKSILQKELQEDDTKRIKIREEAARRIEEERIKAEMEIKKAKEEKEEAERKAKEDLEKAEEEEKKRKIEEEKKAKLEEIRKKEEEAEIQRVEEDMKKKAAEEVKRKAEEEEKKRLMAEEKRKMEEKIKRDEAEAKLRKEQAEKLRAEEEAKKQAAEREAMDMARREELVAATETKKKLSDASISEKSNVIYEISKLKDEANEKINGLAANANEKLKNISDRWQGNVDKVTKKVEEKIQTVSKHAEQMIQGERKLVNSTKNSMKARGNSNPTSASLFMKENQDMEALAEKLRAETNDARYVEETKSDELQRRMKHVLADAIQTESQAEADTRGEIAQMNTKILEQADEKMVVAREILDKASKPKENETRAEILTKAKEIRAEGDLLIRKEKSDAIEILANAKKKFGEIVRGLEKSQAEEIKKTQAEVQLGTTSLKEYALNEVKAVAQAKREMEGKINHVEAEVTKESIMKYAKDAEQELKAKNEKLKEELQKNDGRLEEYIKKQDAKNSKDFQDVSENAYEVMQSAKERAIIRNRGDVLGETPEEEKLRDKLKNAVESIVQKGKERIEKLQEEAGKSTKNIGNDIHEKLNMLTSEVVKGSNAVQPSTDVMKSIEADNNDIAERFYQIRQYGEAELAERGSTPLEEVRKEVFSRIANFTDPIRKKIHDSENKLQNAVETAEQSMRLLEDTTKHDFSSGVQEVVEKTKEDLDEAVDAARKDDEEMMTNKKHEEEKAKEEKKRKAEAKMKKAQEEANRKAKELEDSKRAKEAEETKKNEMRKLETMTEEEKRAHDEERKKKEEEDKKKEADAKAAEAELEEASKKDSDKKEKDTKAKETEKDNASKDKKPKAGKEDGNKDSKKDSKEKEEKNSHKKDDKKENGKATKVEEQNDKIPPFAMKKDRNDKDASKNETASDIDDTKATASNSTMNNVTSSNSKEADSADKSTEPDSKKEASESDEKKQDPKTDEKKEAQKSDEKKDATKSENKSDDAKEEEKKEKPKARKDEKDDDRANVGKNHLHVKFLNHVGAQCGAKIMSNLKHDGYELTDDVLNLKALFKNDKQHNVTFHGGDICGSKVLLNGQEALTFSSGKAADTHTVDVTFADDVGPECCLKHSNTPEPTIHSIPSKTAQFVADPAPVTESVPIEEPVPMYTPVSVVQPEPMYVQHMVPTTYMSAPAQQQPALAMEMGPTADYQHPDMSCGCEVCPCSRSSIVNRVYYPRTSSPAPIYQQSAPQSPSYASLYARDYSQIKLSDMLKRGAQQQSAERKGQVPAKTATKSPAAATAAKPVVSRTLQQAASKRSPLTYASVKPVRSTTFINLETIPAAVHAQVRQGIMPGPKCPPECNMQCGPHCSPMCCDPKWQAYFKLLQSKMNKKHLIAKKSLIHRQAMDLGKDE